jgi:TM2 domain-containing membrane protein YozV
MKDKNIAGILALLLGGFGAHRFYLGQVGLGFFYLIFFWFPLIWIIGLIDAIVLFAMDKAKFDVTYNKSFVKVTPRQYDAPRQQTRAPQRQQPIAQPNAAEHLKNSGIRKFKDFDYENAIADFHKALKISPRDVAVHFNLACAYSLTENTDKALEHLDKAVGFGFNDFKRIKEHDALAYLRVQPQFEEFERNGFRLVQPLTAAQEPVLDLNNDTLLEQLKRLGELRDRGLLTEEEFAIQKKKLMK